MSEIINLHSTDAEDEFDNAFTRLCNRCFSKKEEKVDPYDLDLQRKDKSRYKTNGFTQFRWLVWRNFVDVFKNPFEIRLRLILAVVCFRSIIEFFDSISDFVL